MSNREYLFRGKRIDNGEWVEGSIVHQTDLYGTKVDRYFIIDGTETEDYDIGPAYEVIPETVGEYIERNDKNGKKIFNNDIVKTKYGRLCVVYRLLSPTYNAYDLRCIETTTNISHKAPDKFDIWWSENLEVIGNVHDNPELLEVQK